MTIPGMLLPSERSVGGLKPRSEKSMLTANANGLGSQDVLVVIVDSGHDVFGVDGHDALVAVLGSTRVGDAYDSAPLDVVRLPSGFCLNVLVTLGHGHFSVKTMSHMREIKSGDGWKK